MTHSLDSTLAAFADRANSHPSLPKLLAGWDRNLVIEATDTGEVVSLPVRGARVGAPVSSSLADGEAVQLQASSALLVDIFSGTTSPVDAALEGLLAVFGSDTDQIKLDAIALVLWGT